MTDNNTADPNAIPYAPVCDYRTCKAAPRWRVGGSRLACGQHLSTLMGDAGASVEPFVDQGAWGRLAAVVDKAVVDGENAPCALCRITYGTGPTTRARATAFVVHDPEGRVVGTCRQHAASTLYALGPGCHQGVVLDVLPATS